MQILAEILTNFDPSLKKLHSQIEKVPTYLHNLEVMRGQKIKIIHAASFSKHIS